MINRVIYLWYWFWETHQNIVNIWNDGIKHFQQPFTCTVTENKYLKEAVQEHTSNNSWGSGRQKSVHKRIDGDSP